MRGTGQSEPPRLIACFRAARRPSHGSIGPSSLDLPPCSLQGHPQPAGQLPRARARRAPARLRRSCCTWTVSGMAARAKPAGILADGPPPPPAATSAAAAADGLARPLAAFDRPALFLQKTLAFSGTRALPCCGAAALLARASAAVAPRAPRPPPVPAVRPLPPRAPDPALEADYLAAAAERGRPDDTALAVLRVRPPGWSGGAAHPCVVSLQLPAATPLNQLTVLATPPPSPALNRRWCGRYLPRARPAQRCACASCSTAQRPAWRTCAACSRRARLSSGAPCGGPRKQAACTLDTLPRPGAPPFRALTSPHPARAQAARHGLGGAADRRRRGRPAGGVARGAAGRGGLVRAVPAVVPPAARRRLRRPHHPSQHHPLRAAPRLQYGAPSDPGWLGGVRTHGRAAGWTCWLSRSLGGRGDAGMRMRRQRRQARGASAWALQPRVRLAPPPDSPPRRPRSSSCARPRPRASRAAPARGLSACTAPARRSAWPPSACRCTRSTGARCGPWGAAVGRAGAAGEVGLWGVPLRMLGTSGGAPAPLSTTRASPVPPPPQARRRVSFAAARGLAASTSRLDPLEPLSFVVPALGGVSGALLQGGQPWWARARFWASALEDLAAAAAAAAGQPPSGRPTVAASSRLPPRRPCRSGAGGADRAAMPRPCLHSLCTTPLLLRRCPARQGTPVLRHMLLMRLAQDAAQPCTQRL